jgi:hypothetical protein
MTAGRPTRSQTHRKGTPSEAPGDALTLIERSNVFKGMPLFGNEVGNTLRYGVLRARPGRILGAGVIASERLVGEPGRQRFVVECAEHPLALGVVLENAQHELSCG